MIKLPIVSRYDHLRASFFNRLLDCALVWEQNTHVANWAVLPPSSEITSFTSSWIISFWLQLLIAKDHQLLTGLWTHRDATIIYRQSWRNCHCTRSRPSFWSSRLTKTQCYAKLQFENQILSPFTSIDCFFVRTLKSSCMHILEYIDINLDFSLLLNLDAVVNQTGHQ